MTFTQGKAIPDIEIRPVHRHETLLLIRGD